MMALIVLPLVTAVVCLIVRGGGMTRRAAEEATNLQGQQAEYIRSVAGTRTSATDQITQAKQLYDAGAINSAEYDRFKTAALN